MSEWLIVAAILVGIVSVVGVIGGWGFMLIFPSILSDSQNHENRLRKLEHQQEENKP